MTPLRRTVIVLSLILLLWFAYRVFAVYTVRVGECKPKPVDPNLRLLTRDENGQIVSFPERIGYPAQTRPLIVMTYNIAGHDEVYDGNHVRKIAETIRQQHPDIVGLQEVHRKTWQSRFHDQALELQKLTGMNLFFGASFGEAGGGFGNALLTRGDILSATVHPLPSVGEPRSLIESVVRVDGAVLNVYVTHLTAWGRIKSVTATSMRRRSAMRSGSSASRTLRRSAARTSASPSPVCANASTTSGPITAGSLSLRTL